MLPSTFKPPFKSKSPPTSNSPSTFNASDKTNLVDAWFQRRDSAAPVIYKPAPFAVAELVAFVATLTVKLDTFNVS